MRFAAKVAAKCAFPKSRATGSTARQSTPSPGSISAGNHDDEGGTRAITDACRAIYRTIANCGTWGIAALSHVSGLDFDGLSEAEAHRINALPAMIYHGVRTEDAVLMRMNAAPRSVAENLGKLYRETVGEKDGRYSVVQAREFLKNLSERDWHRARPDSATLSGRGYKRLWEVLSGEAVS